MPPQKPTQEEIETRYEVLPTKARDFMFSDDVVERIADISDTHNLTDAQMDALSEEVNLAALAFTTRESFPTELAKRLSVSPEIAQHIAREASETILEPMQKLSAQSGDQGVRPQSEQEKAALIRAELKQGGGKQLRNLVHEIAQGEQGSQQSSPAV